MKAISTWMFKDTRYFAFDDIKSFAIVNEYGNNYGSWATVKEFRKYQSARNEIAFPVGKCSVSVRAL